MVTLVPNVAVAALPVQEPEEPVQLPVTSPVKSAVTPPLAVKTLVEGL